MDIIILILNTIGLIFLIRYAVSIVKEYKAAEDKRHFLSIRRFRHSISLALIIGIPLILANFIFPLVFKNYLFAEIETTTAPFVLSAVISFLISMIWLIYVRRLDIYETERWVFPAVTFVLACLSTVFLTGWMYSQLDGLGISLYGKRSVIYEFLYCVFAIGGIEEFCKLLPVLFVLLFFKKAINEPYDYIFYGSVSALGFAFIENTGYIFNSHLYNINGRALYAVVAHMTFTSTLCYGLMLLRFKFTRWKGIVIIPFYFLLAIGGHGFYDFWLINNWVTEYSALTTVFFLITVHLWATMKNNAINVSNYFSPDVTLNNDSLRYYLIVSLSSLVMLSYLIVALMNGSTFANQYLLFETLAFGYLIFYLAFGLSRYRIIQDRINPLQVPFDFFVPKPSKIASSSEDEGVKGPGASL